ncbi:MAG TPA: YtxH domain-containing protein [Nitrospirota bacterium]|jgi:gas vesicle protein
MMYEERGSTGTIVLAAVVGGLVGAGIALLTAPRSGRETREKLAETATDTKERVKGWASDTKTRLSETFSKAKEQLTERPGVSTAIEAGKRAMEEEKQRLSGS